MINIILNEKTDSFFFIFCVVFDVDEVDAFGVSAVWHFSHNTLVEHYNEVRHDSDLVNFLSSARMYHSAFLLTQ